MADRGRQAVYSGEQAVEFLLDVANAEGASRSVTVGPVTLVMPVERKFASIESIQDYCDRVCSIFDFSPVTVRPRKGHTKATYHLGVIAIPDQTCGWAMREIVVLHELAHHGVGVGHGHDSAFREQFVLLVEECMAPEVALALRLSWYQEGVE